MEWSKAKDVLLAKEVLTISVQGKDCSKWPGVAGSCQQPHEKLPREIREADLKGY